MKKKVGKMAEHHVTKREVTVLKIEMASEAIRKENDRRRKHNKKLLKKGTSDPLSILRPTFIHTARKTPQMPMYTKGVDTIVRSNKYLCGHLGALCVVLKEANIPYPWMEEVA